MLASIMGLKTIGPAALHHRMQAEPITVIDVNSPESWTNARVPGALNLDPAGYQVSDLPQDKATSLVFYCSNPMCRKAPTSARRARKMGYDNVTVMSAGISGWLAAGLATDGGA